MGSVPPPPLVRPPAINWAKMTPAERLRMREAIARDTERRRASVVRSNDDAEDGFLGGLFFGWLFGS